MKNIILSAFAALAAITLPGCVTQVGVTAEQAAGQGYAEFELNQATSASDAAARIAALTRLQTDLPNIPLGKVSNMELGALNAQLQAAKEGINTSDPTKQQILGQIASLINLVATNASSTGGENLNQAALSAGCTNAATGISLGIQYVEGGWSVTNPSWVPVSGVK
jgi:hypothetical protein